MAAYSFVMLIISSFECVIAQKLNLFSDVNTLFRGNTLLTKCIDELMKLIGRHYLQSVLKRHIDRIYAEQKCCEVDSSRLSEMSDVTANLVSLLRCSLRLQYVFYATTLLWHTYEI